ncbi:multiple sugar transport system substrate-binding protein [Pullulanibacillus pueri]|uniref:ABC transporter substrate-binding protein n=1 Tax=Pullulanibacillus pueri TaxID=1437324 RepID=A0A8J2ZY81_9BACL|nr:ABC transporter substrate-binding protein [Pullulanibacillus pueri]MBM7682921.1 multiple sugar transport system substrate-binding protein [Pullulanibacillus pueri]GGH84782.1 ABC transporter substrate-binding protein [Pullulanibacillus pueri]
MRFFKKSTVMLVVFLLAMGTLLAACGDSKDEASSGSKKGKTEIEFWSFWGSGTRKPVIEKIVDDFNKSQDKIHVTYKYLPFGDIWTKELASVAAGNPPDVIINDINSVQQRAQKNQSVNLAKYVKNDPDLKDQFYPQLWNTVLYKNDPYAIPFNTDTRVLFYNKDLFKEAGLDPNKPPTTWDELAADAKKLDKKSGSQYTRLGFLPRYGIGPDVWIDNATGVGEWDYKNGKPVINDPKAVQALQWIKDYEANYGSKVINTFQSQFGSEQADPFISGKLGMEMNAATFYTQIRDFGKNMDFGVAPMPEMTSGNGHTSWGGGFVAEIPKGAKHPDASYEFIKFLTSAKEQAYWASKNFDNVANIQGSKDAAKDLSGKAKEVYQLAVENLDQTLITPQPIEAPDYTSLVNPEIDKVMLGKKSPQAALDDAQKAVEKLAKSNK